MAAFRLALVRSLAFACSLFAIVSCEGDKADPAVLSTVAVSLAPSTVAIGQTATATAAGHDQNDDPIDLGTVTWSSSAGGVATVDAAGVVTGVAAGTAEIIATVDGKTGQQTITVTAAPALVINEVESNGGTPGDWAEIYNPTGSAVDISGWVFKDNDDTHAYALPSGTTIAAGGYLVLEEADLGYGLGSADAARLFTSFGTLVDSYTWTAHASTTYGRCPNGSGEFTTTTSSTKGTANACPGELSILPWPGSDNVVTIDGLDVFGTNLSGLTYEPAAGSSSAVIWAVQNGPGTLYRLTWDGTIWTPETTDGWATGKALHYPGGTGNPDAEGVTFAATTSAGIYVSTERNNDANSVSRTSILRFDASQGGTSLTATHEWNLTSDLPVVGANTGLEAITWIPDQFLVAHNFYDETAGHAYTPVDYADHGDGLFFVGVEANGMVYAYALNHTTSGFTRVASFTSGFAGVMDLAFDRELGYLWAICDDGCGGQSNILEIDQSTGTSTSGRFAVTHKFERPSTMPNINNEGFTMAPQAECVEGVKPAFWSDDNGTSGHSIRRAGVLCTAFP